ncbi:STAS domain-containing protein [bacterium]|nr:STAS domain-containing protein [bacterium]
MIVNIREREGITIPDIEGKMVGPESLKLKEIVNERLKSLPEYGIRILLNLEKVPAIDSSGLGAIIAMYTSVKRQNGSMALLNAGKSIRSIIVMAKLMNLFERYDNEDEAIAALKDNENSNHRQRRYAVAG